VCIEEVYLNEGKGEMCIGKTGLTLISTIAPATPYHAKQAIEIYNNGYTMCYYLALDQF
jgi:hypothetical protein